MNCPACKTPMVILEYKNVEIDFCLSCKGCWLDRGELGLILTGNIDTPEDWKIEGARKSKRRCPRCHAKMMEGLLPGTDVMVDVCRNHHGIWFDEGELVAVAREQTDDNRAGALAGFVAEIFGEEKKEDNTEL